MISKYRTGVVILGLIALMLVAGAAAAQEGGDRTRDAELEREVLARLEAINPEAVPLFVQATADLDSGNFESARAGYQEVLNLAPGFPDALRRLSYVLSYQGDAQQAVKLARRALELQDMAFNEQALAYALLGLNTAAGNAEALTLAESAVNRLPDDYYGHFVLGLAAMANEDLGALRQAADATRRLEPNDPVGHYFAGLAAAEEEKWTEAERELLKAEGLGFPSEEIHRLLDLGISTEARNMRLARSGAYIIGGWLAGVLLLFLLGSILSRLTIASLKRKRGQDLGSTSGFERALRSVYRAVIVLASAYYYVSMPMLIVIVIAVFGGAAYLIIKSGTIPTGLMTFLGAAGLGTLYAIVRAIFTRVKESEPGRQLTRQEAPEFWALAERVAQKVGTRPVDQIYMVPGTEIAVTEQGPMLDKLRDRGRRMLIVGLAALDGMTEDQFKAILAHEYGHFSGRDTAGGNVAYQVQLSMQHLALRLALARQARVYNPAWWFVNGYHRIYLRITLGASRLQETLADRVAALAYGSQNMIAGLEQVIRRSLEFDAQANAEIKQAVEEKRGLNNLYLLPALPSEAQEEMETRLRKELERESSPYDSHPSYQERVKSVRALDIPEQEAAVPAPVLQMIPAADSLQQEMTAMVEENVARRLGRSKLAQG
jgi:Zn-dependent protease with chaperone function